MGKPQCVLIAAARFYDDITDELIKGAGAALAARGVVYEIIEVPGALEAPAVIAMAHNERRFVRYAAEERYQGAIALGCVIRGETSHYDIVAGESARALMDLSLRTLIPIGNGILTVETMAQAWERADVTQLNKGGDAAKACLTLMDIAAKLAFRSTCL